MQRTVLVRLAKGQADSHNCLWKGIFRLLSLVQHKEVWGPPLGDSEAHWDLRLCRWAQEQHCWWVTSKEVLRISKTSKFLSTLACGRRDSRTSETSLLTGKITEEGYVLEMLASCLRSSPQINSGLKKKDEQDSYLGKKFKKNGFFPA